MKRSEFKMALHLSSEESEMHTFREKVTNGNREPAHLTVTNETFKSLGNPKEITVTLYALKATMPTVMLVKDKGIVNYKRTFECTLSDGATFIFDFFDDEIHFQTRELIGLTKEGCWDLFSKRDIAYLRS